MLNALATMQTLANVIKLYLVVEAIRPSLMLTPLAKVQTSH
jgi:hypothetical protein